MATTTTPTLAAGTAATRRTTPLWRTTAVAGVAAAAATTAVAGVVHAAGVSLAIDGEAIPLLGFAQLTLLGAALGGLLLAVLVRTSTAPRRRFLQLTVALTALSCVPSLAWPDDVATKVALVATHVLAAAIILPALARRTRG
jgi:hypothetical protein